MNSDAAMYFHIFGLIDGQNILFLSFRFAFVCVFIFRGPHTIKYNLNGNFVNFGAADGACVWLPWCEDESMRGFWSFRSLLSPSGELAFVISRDRSDSVEMVECETYERIKILFV